MTGSAFALILLAGFAHASWNLLAKRVGSGGIAFVWCFAGAEVVVVTPIAVGMLLTGTDVDAAIVGAAALSGLLHSAYLLLLQRAYASGELSVVYPVARGLGPLLAVVGAVVLLGERPSGLAYFGAAAVSTGVFWLASIGRSAADSTADAPGGSAVPSGPDAPHGWTGVPGLGLAIATGACIASYTVWDGFSVGSLGAPPLVFFWGVSLTRFVVLTGLVRARRSPVTQVWQQHRREVIGIGVLAPSSYVLVLFAFTLAPVAYVAPAREISIVIATLFGVHLLGERGAIRRLCAATVIVAGVVTLGLG